VCGREAEKLGEQKEDTIMPQTVRSGKETTWTHTETQDTVVKPIDEKLSKELGVPVDARVNVEFTGRERSEFVEHNYQKLPHSLHGAGDLCAPEGP